MVGGGGGGGGFREAAGAESPAVAMSGAAAASPGPGPAQLPEWKRAILERKRAKLAAGVAGPLERGAGPREAAAGERERLVVAESLGPLRENPFMRLEGEQRRRRRRRPGPGVLPEPPSPAAAPPAEPPALAQLLELYSAVPGIRTIRADNILIIESRDSSPPPGPARRSRAAATADPFRELLARGGAAVTEICAAEVLLYEPEPQPPDSEPQPEPGRVSRLLQKFNQRPGAGPERGRGRAAPCRPESLPVPNPSLRGPPAAPSSPPGRSGPGPGSPVGHLLAQGFVHKTGSNSFTVNPRACRPAVSGQALSNGPVDWGVATEPVVSEDGRSRRQVATVLQPASPPPPPPSPNAAAALPILANSWKPKFRGVVDTPLLFPEQSSASLDCDATASTARPMPLRTSGCTFEIRPAFRPDLAAIPAHDLQAKALASLRLNSRNSFLFVPHPRREAPAPAEHVAVPPTLAKGALPAAAENAAEALVPVTYIDEDLVELDAKPLAPLRVLSPRLEGFDVPHEGNSPLGIEDSEVLPYKSSCAAGLPSLSQKGSNTFTVVPKRKPPGAMLETFSRAQLQEEQEEEEEESQAKTRTDVPRQDLGPFLKKRYPTVNEIEVIGGYLTLERSCMSKSGSQGKKVTKMGFSDYTMM